MNHLKRCHCGTIFTEWSTLTDYANNKVYHICPRCLCIHQELTVNSHGKTIWVNLPQDPLNCPKISKTKKTYLKLKKKIPKLRKKLKNLIKKSEPTHDKVDELMRQGWKLRKKKIKGTYYAYLQKGRSYKYVGRWQKEYENK